MNDTPKPVVRTITQEQLHAYAAASGDHNPIHVDPAFAASTPFGGTVAHGMLVLALIGEMMHSVFGERWLTEGSMKVRFKAPTRPGDTVTATATPRGDGGEFVVQCANQAGEMRIEGRASIGATA